MPGDRGEGEEERAVDRRREQAAPSQATGGAGPGGVEDQRGRGQGQAPNTIVDPRATTNLLTAMTCRFTGLASR